MADEEAPEGMRELEPSDLVPPLKRELVHPILSDEYLGLIQSTIDKFKLGLEIWWSASVETMQIPIQNPATGEVMAMSPPQVVVRIILLSRGYVLGPENYVNTILVTNPMPIIPDLERVVIKGMETLNQQRAAQMNGPSTATGKKS